MSQESFKQLYEWAEKVKREFAVEYNLQGVKKIEEAIVASRDAFESWTEDEQYYRVYSFGAFLGQCMIANFNGEWHSNEGSVGIKIPQQNVWADPFHKVWKQIQKDGQFDSISSFYEISGNFDSIINSHEKAGD